MGGIHIFFLSIQLEPPLHPPPCPTLHPVPAHTEWLFKKELIANVLKVTLCWQLTAVQSALGSSWDCRLLQSKISLDVMTTENKLTEMMNVCLYVCVSAFLFAPVRYFPDCPAG